MELRQILKRSLRVCFDFDGSKFSLSGDLLFVKYFIHQLSHCEFIQLRKCQRAFFKIMGFAGKSFLFSPPLPLPAASISVALAQIFAPPKSEKRLERAENPTETLATQAISVLIIINCRLLFTRGKNSRLNVGPHHIFFSFVLTN